MEVFAAIKKRHSVRAFEKREIPKEKILKILEAGRLALLLIIFSHGIL